MTWSQIKRIAPKSDIIDKTTDLLFARHLWGRKIYFKKAWKDKGFKNNSIFTNFVQVSYHKYVVEHMLIDAC